ncbi:TraR/DksA family transcriptional regulator [Streptomyces sp. NPDC057148]|uniref:TraR/DksA family transcriptional regulator n=1 Tax=unclassified Streptomyces TaxID=2593676 RepID=UPI00364050BB
MTDDPPADGTPAADEESRRRLTEQAAVLRRQIAAAPSRDEELRADCLLDAADAGAAAEALERHRRETGGARELLVRTEAALVRLDTGGFGRCARCGEAIDPERLHAFPHLERCLRCEAEGRSGSR